MTLHTHWVIQAYSEVLPDGKITDVVEIDLMADSEEEALASAQALAPGRERYRLMKVFQHDPAIESD